MVREKCIIFVLLFESGLEQAFFADLFTNWFLSQLGNIFN